MMEPKEIAEQLEQRAELPGGEEERFAGYAVMGVPFASGHVLGLRRFPASSLGSGYTSVWQRDPSGRWVFCQDAPPEQGCSRYFGSALDGSLVGQIRIVWSGPREFTVSVEGGLHLNWRISLTQTPGARLLNAVSQALPGSLWQRPAALKLMGKAAGSILGAGRISLVGQVPNGQRFITNPRFVWIVADCAATLDGQDLGPAAPLRRRGWATSGSRSGASSPSHRRRSRRSTRSGTCRQRPGGAIPVSDRLAPPHHIGG